MHKSKRPRRAGGFRELIFRLLSFLHPLPAYKTVNIVEEECHKADENGNIWYVRERRNAPENDQDEIVKCVGKRKIGASPECEVDRNEARQNR